MEIFAVILASVLFIVGIIGSVVPTIPGVILIYVGMLLYGVITGFTNLTANFLVGQGLSTLLVLGMDYLTTALGAKKFGASRYAVWGAVLGLFLGVLLFNFPGIIFGPFLGAFIGETIKGTSTSNALKSSLGTLIGVVGGIFIKLFVIVIMIIWFYITIWS